MVRFGIVGCGKIAPTHAEALQSIDGACLAAVYDTAPTVGRAFAKRYDLAEATTWKSFLDRVDAVIVATPSGLHAQIGSAAAQAGKHVVVEKPIDVSVEAAEALVRAAEASKVKLACISQHRFSREMRRLHEAASQGGLGRLIQGDAAIKWYRTQQYYDSGDWRGTYALDGGGCLMNQGVHYVDMIQWIMGGVRAVQAMCRTLNHNIEVEDTAMAMVEYRNCAVGVIRGSTCCFPEMAERLEVHGTHGSVVLERDRVRLWHVDPLAAGEGQYGGGVMMQPAPAATIRTSEVDEDDPTAKWGEQHRLQLEDFTQSIRDGRDPFITGRMAIEPLRVILAIYESSRRGGARVEIA